MMPRSEVSYRWKNPQTTRRYTTGVSLHTHTSMSLETLSFIHAMCTCLPLVGRVVDFYDRASRRHRNLPLDFEAAHWRPPLTPRMTFDSEHRQIANLGLEPLISITDHDDIQAPLLLRTIASARHIPVSLEWSVPFGPTSFHLGIHNLPSAAALGWMERFVRFTAAPEEAVLTTMLTELDAIPQVLIVLNHPMWDLHKIGTAEHERELERFLTQHNGRMHALELNGLRHARENRQVMTLTDRWQQLLISGGDRHGMEANANINLTDATSFNEFVHEIRVKRLSHVLFMDQYQRPWEQRILGSTLDAITDHPEFSPGWQRWDERAFHPDVDGTLRPLSELWPNGRAPWALRAAIATVLLFRSRTMAKLLGIAFPRVNEGLVEEETVVGKTA